jgi:hypothetical protein
MSLQCILFYPRLRLLSKAPNLTEVVTPRARETFDGLDLDGRRNLAWDVAWVLVLVLGGDDE